MAIGKWGKKKQSARSLRDLEQELQQQEPEKGSSVQIPDSLPDHEPVPEAWTEDEDLPEPGGYSLSRKCWCKLRRKTCSPGLTFQECEGMDLQKLCYKLKEAGFYKIAAYPSRDLSYRRKKLVNTVSGITIGGSGDFRRNTVFPFDAQIEIVYHQLKTVAVGFSPQELRGSNAEETKAYFKHQGFGVVKTVPIRDLKMGWLKMDGQVEQVLVDGFDHFKPDSRFPADCEITVYYHTYKTDR